MPFRTRSVEEVREIMRKMRAELWDTVTAGSLRNPIDSSYPLDDVSSALARMRANQHFGKILLIP